MLESDVGVRCWSPMLWVRAGMFSVIDSQSLVVVVMVSVRVCGPSCATLPPSCHPCARNGEHAMFHFCEVVGETIVVG